MKGFLIQRTTVLGLTRFPIETFDLICENHAGNGSCLRQGDFKRISFDLACDGAEQGQADLSIIGFRRENERRSPTWLLMPCLWREHQPDNIPPFWTIRCLHQKSSNPAASPVLTSAWRFFGVICFNSVSKANFLGRIGVMTRWLSSTSRSTEWPGANIISRAAKLGIRIARLLPHF